jgi:hypothetical protein
LLSLNIKSLSMSIKSILRFLPVLILTLLLACGDDDDKKTAYSFKDQDLSGEIEGDNWTYEDGFVDQGTFDDEEILDISLFLAQDDPACETFSREGDEVFFFVPNAVGLYKLSFDLGSFDGQVVTLFDDEEFLNVIATEGAIEILTITETEVTGRIDARADGNNHVNGNFTVSFCAGV